MSRRGENIYKRKDGRWEGRVLKRNGKYKSLYAKSYKEIKIKLNTFNENIIAVDKQIPKCEISGLFESWLDGDIKCRIKPTTYESYYRSIKKYVIPYFENITENELTVDIIKKYVLSIQENDIISGAYKNKILTVFKIALKDIIHDTDECSTLLNAVKIPSANYMPVEVFSAREQQLVEMEAVRMNDTKALGLLLCFYTGIRIGELCALKWENINFDLKTISIFNTVYRTMNLQKDESKTLLTRGSPKSRNSVRIVPIPDVLLDMALELKGCESNETFIISGKDTPMDPRTYQRIYKKMLSRLGIKHRKFHAIRHTFSTRALEVGVDIKTLSEILGHSSALITLKVYTHSMMEQKIMAVNKLCNIHFADTGNKRIAVTGAVVNE